MAPLTLSPIAMCFTIRHSFSRVTATDQMHCLFGFICWGSIATHKCDQLVGARYKVTVDDYFVYAKGKAEVSGYPSKLVEVEVIDAVKHPEVIGIPHDCQKKDAGFNFSKFIGGSMSIL